MTEAIRKLRWQELVEVRRIRNLCVSVVESREGVTPEVIVVIYGTSGGADEIARTPSHERHAVARMIATAEAICDAIEVVGESWLGAEAMCEPPYF